jgi:hypothetical protein
LVIFWVPLTGNALALALGVEGLVEAEGELLFDTAVAGEYLAEEVNVYFVWQFDPKLCVGDIGCHGVDPPSPARVCRAVGERYWLA